MEPKIKTTLKIMLLLLALLPLTALTACNSKNNNFPRHVTSDTWDEIVIESKIPVLVYFHWEGCPFCRDQRPTVTRLQPRTQDFMLVLADVGNSEMLAIFNTYGSVFVPGWVLFVENQPILSTYGLLTRQQIIDMVNNALSAHNN